MNNFFDYDLAFSRTLGWITEPEKKILRKKKVAIAGMGGVGGSHLITCVRLGLENFHIADFDHFSVENFNRQAGATMDTVGKQKALVMKEMAQAINPNVNILVFEEGVKEENVEEFFDGVDIYMDGLDFFCFKARIMVFDYCYHHNIPATTAGPLGMGSAFINFLPGKMSFNDYFNLSESYSDFENACRFALGLSPWALHIGYIADSKYVRLEERKGPSTPMGCMISSGIACTEVLKILLGRGKIYAAPWSLQYDAYKQVLKKSLLFWGNKGVLQRLKILFMKMRWESELKKNCK